MSDSNIPVAEQFLSIQGEGEYAGKPAVFLRLAGCNLMCGGWHNKDIEDQEDMHPSEDASWVCDTIDVWRDPDYAPGVSTLVSQWENWGWLDKFENGAHLILTGGEPTLPTRQSQIVDLVDELISREVDPFIEVETNGTIETTGQFDAIVDHYNVSLKLSNSGMDEDERLNNEAIDWYIERHERDWAGGAIFKFVVGGEEDVDEIRELVETYSIPQDMVYLMPAGASQEQLRETYPVVAEICKEEGWRFSPRLQVDCWDLATGV